MTRELRIGPHIVLIDEEDAALVSQYRWYVTCAGSRKNPSSLLYVRGYLPGCSAGPHTPLHALLTGQRLTDHVNHDGLDNRRENLRPASQQQNMWNRRSFHGQSRYKGVIRRRGRWAAQIKRSGQYFYLGLFDSEEAAAQAYDSAARDLFGVFATLNGES